MKKLLMVMLFLGFGVSAQAQYIAQIAYSDDGYVHLAGGTPYAAYEVDFPGAASPCTGYLDGSGEAVCTAYGSWAWVAAGAPNGYMLYTSNQFWGTSPGYYYQFNVWEAVGFSLINPYGSYGLNLTFRLYDYGGQTLLSTKYGYLNIYEETAMFASELFYDVTFYPSSPEPYHMLIIPTTEAIENYPAVSVVECGGGDCWQLL